jgi:hypothetical protein
LVALLVAIVTVVGAVAVAAVVTRSSSSWYADDWDERVAPIAREVSRLRGLEFEHPVPIRFLTTAEFKKEVGVDEATLDDSDRKEFEQGAAFLRALGLLDGDVDLKDAIDTAATSGILAYYDNDLEEIVVRGQDLDVKHRATLAHELVHVLQDQHFHIDALQKEADESETGDSSALRALIEGDAERIEDEYVSTLSEAEQSDYNEQRDAEGNTYEDETADLPEIIEFTFASPYIFGPPTIRVLLADGGNDAVDRALSGPPPASRMFMEPGVLEGSRMEAPEPPPGVKLEDEAEHTGPLDMYFTLAGRIDPQRALRAADLVTAGRDIHYRDPDRDVECVRIALHARRGAEGELIAALKDWAAAVPGVSVTSGYEPTITACDPGKGAKGPKDGTLEKAVQLLALRGQLTAEVAEADVPPETARCIARLFVRGPGIVDLLLKYTDEEPTGADAERISNAAQQASAQCYGDESAGLP